MLARRAEQLALQAMFYLASVPPGDARTSQEIAETLGVPRGYLAKVLQSLTRTGLLRAARGPSGGVYLARPAEDITLYDVLLALEPAGSFDQCLLGLGHCNDQEPCALHTAWLPIRAQILELAKCNSLQEFAGHGRREELLEGRARKGA